MGGVRMNDDLVRAVRALEEGPSGISDVVRDFVEWVTFASADEIVEMLDGSLARDWMGLPVWARNLAFQMACLRRPDDGNLWSRAAADLYSFGPDWDAQAEAMARRGAASGGPGAGVVDGGSATRADR